MLQIKDIDRGYAEMRKRVEDLKNRRITVGIHAKDDGRSSAGDKTTNLQIGTAHEFGAVIQHPGGTPYMLVKGRAVFLKKGDARATGVTQPHTIVLAERSFLRTTLDENGPKYVAMCKQMSVQVLEGKLIVDRALGLLGEAIKADVVMRFNRNAIRPDISEATKQRKGSTTVLIDTAALKQSIDYIVRGTAESASALQAGAIND